MIQLSNARLRTLLKIQSSKRVSRGEINASSARRQPTPPSLAGSGLRGLADRITALDGHLCVETSPGGGTLVRDEAQAGPVYPSRSISSLKAGSLRIGSKSESSCAYDRDRSERSIASPR